MGDPAHSLRLAVSREQRDPASPVTLLVSQLTARTEPLPGQWVRVAGRSALRDGLLLDKNHKHVPGHSASFLKQHSSSPLITDVIT